MDLLYNVIVKLYTIGHSTRPIDAFVKILKPYEIEILVDIRTIPKSRHNPQFEENNLENSLIESGIGYIYMKDLGGLRNPAKDSKNLEWRNTSFRGFADYMGTDEFENAINKLKDIAGSHKTVIMCAEALPWRCHRNLIADALVVQKWKVVHLMTDKISNEHRLTEFLKVASGKCTYPKK
ncbi:MAG: DNA repair protein [Candidatus Levybacteria bacterium CG10_big_fil_rev_8_21_14_0_10_36_7]|nr:MAG: DNA repair protein [Candidatus Levybacteria bacterium CG10_big_fil_rev_8_21_14_0_10_36_7]